jgi:4-hydroxy-2-oxoheptanedioate aldolase
VIGSHRFRSKLGTGETIIGPVVNFNSAWIVDIAGLIGFDYVLLDCEHGPMTAESIEMMIRAAEVAGISPIVRVPGNVPHEILRFLDIGAAGVQVPHVESAADARRAAAAVRYPPLGERGLAPTTRAAGYGIDMPVTRYVEDAHREVVLLVMVETAAAVAAIDEIAATDGIDAVIIGPGDLSSSMGHGGDRSAPEVLEAVRHVISRCKHAGKPVSLPAASVAQGRQCIEMGAHILQVGTAPWLVQAGREFLGGLA